MRLEYHFCAEGECEMCSEPMNGGRAFELHRHEYDPFEYLKSPQPHWLCSEECVRDWDSREPSEVTENDNLASDDLHRAEQARRLK